VKPIKHLSKDGMQAAMARAEEAVMSAAPPLFLSNLLLI